MNYTDAFSSPSTSASLASSASPSPTSSPGGSFVNFQQQRFVKVPFQWRRIQCKEKRLVYYITPSGHVLLRKENVLSYLESKYTCKCYLNLQMKYEDVFDFNIEVGSFSEVSKMENPESARCELWMQTIPENYLRGQMLLALDYLTCQEVDSLEEVYKILHRCSTVEKQTLYSWLEDFEWDKIRVTRDGRMFAQNLSREQLSHLTYELSNTMELNNAQAAITSASGAPCTLTEATHCDTSALSHRLDANTTFPGQAPISLPTLPGPRVPATITAQQQHCLYPSHVNIGNTVTSSVPASLANFNHASVTPPKANNRRRTATSRTSKAPNRSPISPPVMVVSNAPTTTNPLLSLPFTQLANSSFQRQQQAAPTTTLANRPVAPVLLNEDTGGAGHTAESLRLLMKINEFGQMGNANSAIAPAKPVLFHPTNFSPEQAEQLLMTSEQVQMSGVAPNCGPLPTSTTSNQAKGKMTTNLTESKPRKPRAPRKPRGKKANECNEENPTDLAKAADFLRRKNELAANREFVSSLVANVLDKPRLTKQQDSGHLRAPDALIEPIVQPLPRIESIMPNTTFKYIQIMNPELPCLTAPPKDPQSGTSQMSQASINGQQQPSPSANTVNDCQNQQQQEVHYSIDDRATSSEDQQKPKSQGRPFQPYEMVFDPVEATKLDHAASLLSLANNISFSQNSTDGNRAPLESHQQPNGGFNQNGSLCESYSADELLNFTTATSESTTEPQQQQQVQKQQQPKQEEQNELPPPLIQPPSAEMANRFIATRTGDYHQTMQANGPTEQQEADDCGLGKAEIETIYPNDTVNEAIPSLSGCSSKSSIEVVGDLTANGEVNQVACKEEEKPFEAKMRVDIDKAKEAHIEIKEESNSSETIELNQNTENPVMAPVLAEMNQPVEDIKLECEAGAKMHESHEVPLEENASTLDDLTIDTTTADPSSLLLSPKFETNDSSNEQLTHYETPAQKPATSVEDLKQSPEPVRKTENSITEGTEEVFSGETPDSVFTPHQAADNDDDENPTALEKNQVEAMSEEHVYVRSSEESQEENSQNQFEQVADGGRENDAKKRKRVDRSTPTAPRRSLRTRLSSSNLYAAFKSSLDSPISPSDEQFQQPSTSTSAETGHMWQQSEVSQGSPPPRDDVAANGPLQQVTAAAPVAEGNVIVQEDSSDSVELLESSEEIDVEVVEQEEEEAELPAELNDNQYVDREVGGMMVRDRRIRASNRVLEFDEDTNGGMFANERVNDEPGERNEDARVVPVHEMNMDEDIIFDGNSSPIIEVIDPSMAMDDEDEIIFAVTNHNLMTRHVDLDQSTTSSMLSVGSSSSSSSNANNADHSSTSGGDHSPWPQGAMAGTANQENDANYSEASFRTSPLRADDSPSSSRSTPQANTSRNDATPMREKQTSSNTSDDSSQRYLKQYKRMQRLKKELEFQGRPVKENSDSDEKDRLSPPLPPQDRVFNVGDIVWGQRGDVRYWPGKLVPTRNGRADRPIPHTGKAMVLWFGKGIEKETLISVSDLLTLTEGLEEHHRARKRLRSGSFKRLNRDLEEAIQEAMGWNQPANPTP